jgi:hypothetical protein
MILKQSDGCDSVSTSFDAGRVVFQGDATKRQHRHAALSCRGCETSAAAAQFR